MSETYSDHDEDYSEGYHDKLYDLLKDRTRDFTMTFTEFKNDVQYTKEPISSYPPEEIKKVI